MSFGKKNVDFCGIVSPACAKRATCSTVTGCEQERRRGVAAVDGGDRLVRVRGVARRPRGVERLDDARAEVVVGRDARVAAVAVERDAARPGPATSSPGTSPSSCTSRCVGKISTPGRARRDEDRERVRRARVLLAEGDGGLVAVVAVGDQERRVERRARRRRRARRACARRPPRRPWPARRPGARAPGRRRRAGRSARAASASRAAGAGGPPSGRRACARAAAPPRPRTASPAPTRRSPRACARRRRGRRSPARPTSSAGLGLDEDALARARRARSPAACSLGVRQRQMDDVVRAARQVLEPLRRRR